jgi:signal transduction histidine kinase
MNTLTLRIYLTVVAVLALFAAGSTWLFQHQIAQERVRADDAVSERMEAWGDLIQRSLPESDAPVEAQTEALQEWSQRLRVPLALDDTRGQRIAASVSYLRRQAIDPGVLGFPVRLADGRTLWVLRPLAAAPRQGLRRDGGQPPPPGQQSLWPASWRGVGLVVLLAVLFFAVAAGAWPAVRRLTRRLQALKKGVEQFGAGKLDHRVEVSGRDEVAALAGSFNQAAERIETLVRSHQSLLANASHELRSPLARMKMAVAMLDDAPPERRAQLKREIDTNVAELDALVEEVLLASRLDATEAAPVRERIDLLGVAVEEAARIDAATEGHPVSVRGDERLLRRAIRNLLENARRYGGGEVLVRVGSAGGFASVQVCDRGPGVPAAQRERIFEPFYRMPGHAEQAGGVGLGLSLVRQIVQRHGGRVSVSDREGGGSCFELTLPLA